MDEIEANDDGGYVAVAYDLHVRSHLYLPEDIVQLLPRIEPEEPVRELDYKDHDLTDPLPRRCPVGASADKTDRRGVNERSVNFITVGTATPLRHRVRGSWRQRGSPSGIPESLTVPVRKLLAAGTVGINGNQSRACRSDIVRGYVGTSSVHTAPLPGCTERVGPAASHAPRGWDVASDLRAKQLSQPRYATRAYHTVMLRCRCLRVEDKLRAVFFSDASFCED